MSLLSPQIKRLRKSFKRFVCRIAAGSSTGVRWYEVRSPNATPTVFQQGTFADSSYRWMGSIAMDQNGDIAVGYSVSSSSMHPAIRFTGREPADTLNTMQAETSIIEGTGSQSGLRRWGDYSAMRIDPTDDCTFWYTTEYLTSNGSFNWSTRIASFKFMSCAAPPETLPAAPSNLTATPTQKQPIYPFVDLGWKDNSNNETNFAIERCMGAGCVTFTPLATVGANVTAYHDAPTQRKTTYVYRVKARNGAGSSAYSNTASATTK